MIKKKNEDVKFLERLITPKELNRLNPKAFCLSSIYSWIKGGNISNYRIGGKVFIDMHEFVDVIKHHSYKRRKNENKTNKN